MLKSVLKTLQHALVMGPCRPRAVPGADLRTPRACQQRQGIVQKDFWAGPQTLPNCPGEVSKQVWSSERCRTRPWTDFWSFLCCRAEATICVSYQFLQCFVGFERSKQRTRARGEKRRHSRHFSLPNRTCERSGDPKSHSGGPVRTAKREKAARRFMGVRTTPVGTRK